VAFPLPSNRKPLRPISDSGAYSGDVEFLSMVIIPARSKATLRIELAVSVCLTAFYFLTLAASPPISKPSWASWIYCTNQLGRLDIKIKRYLKEL
jgi:hypothetical protein